jgi:hypothetical protein
MTIICATIQAATQVLAVLLDARLWPGRSFHIAVSYPLIPPFTLTILVTLPADVLRHLRAIPDTTIT